jgi:hypothetical protein
MPIQDHTRDVIFVAPYSRMISILIKLCIKTGQKLRVNNAAPVLSCAFVIFLFLYNAHIADNGISFSNMLHSDAHEYAHRMKSYGYSITTRVDPPELMMQK